MSYARFADGDVYVYAGTSGFVCCSCRLTPRNLEMVGGSKWYNDFVFGSREEMYDHLLIHREAGQKVPDHALHRLLQEIVEGDTMTQHTPVYVTRRVSVNMSEIIERDHEGLLDLLSELAVGNDLLMDINFTLIAIDPVNEGSLILEVTGDPTEAEKFEDYT